MSEAPLYEEWNPIVGLGLFYATINGYSSQSSAPEQTVLTLPSAYKQSKIGAFFRSSIQFLEMAGLLQADTVRHLQRPSPKTGRNVDVYWYQTCGIEARSLKRAYFASLISRLYTDNEKDRFARMAVHVLHYTSADNGHFDKDLCDLILDWAGAEGKIPQLVDAFRDEMARYPGRMQENPKAFLEPFSRWLSETIQLRQIDYTPYILMLGEAVPLSLSSDERDEIFATRARFNHVSVRGRFLAVLDDWYAVNEDGHRDHEVPENRTEMIAMLNGLYLALTKPMVNARNIDGLSVITRTLLGALEVNLAEDVMLVGSAGGTRIGLLSEPDAGDLMGHKLTVSVHEADGVPMLLSPTADKAIGIVDLSHPNEGYYVFPDAEQWKPLTRRQQQFIATISAPGEKTEPTLGHAIVNASFPYIVAQQLTR